MKVLLVGSGGREYTFCHQLVKSPHQPQLFIAPGNAGTARFGTNIGVLPTDFKGPKQAVLAHQIQMVIVGPEVPLVEGMVDFFNADQELAHIPVIGPSKKGAELEGSKEFAKSFMQRHKIPTAKYKSFTKVSLSEGLAYLESVTPPYVLKADGLAAGKGVAVCPDESAAEEFLQEVMVERRFGPGRLLVEECLVGPEISIFAAVSGPDYLILTPARDYKRIGDGDEGPNTGGMGAVASRQLADPELMKQIEEEIVAPTVAGLEKDALNYKGFLYFGLMLTEGGPKIIEYNCRFGDPECQAVMPLISGDLAEFCLEGAKGNLKPELLAFSEGWSVCCILASAGYPDSSRSDDVINGLDLVSNARVYHAGTKKIGGNWATNGGRVLAIVAEGESLQAAVEKAHAEAAKVTFDGSQRRADIGRLHF